jgi:predicted kinase
MRTVFILRGIPSSGKSSFAASLVAKEPKRWVRINRDDLRSMSVGPANNPHTGDKNREEFVREAKNNLLSAALKSGYDVILDDTHLVPQTVKKLHTFVESIGNVKVIEKSFNVDVEEAIARDAKRSGFAHVGEKVIRDMARGAGLEGRRKLPDREVYYPPIGCGDPLTINPDLPTAIMVDLDGTLAIIGDRSPYDATDCDEKDLPNWPVIKTVLAMHAQGVKIIFMSGRDVKYRPETVRFIEKYCRIPANWAFSKENDDRPKDIPISYELHMRGELDLTKVDQRKDSIIKEELFDAHVRGKYNVLYVVDDRNQVVRKWREMGLTVFQCAEGDF